MSLGLRNISHLFPPLLASQSFLLSDARICLPFCLGCWEAPVMKSNHKSRSEGSQTLFSGIFMVPFWNGPKHTPSPKGP